jgi:vanadium chloroperoxidase
MTATSAELRFWVDMALECVRRDHTSSISAGDQRGPFLTARALGMALAAIHDARAVAKGAPASVLVAGPPVPPGLAGLGGNSVIIAAAASGLQTLLLRYPRQTGLLNAAWVHWLDFHGFGAVGGAAEAAGRAYGAGVHGLGLLDSHAARRGAYSPSKPPQPYEHVVPPLEMQQGYSGGAWGMEVDPLLAPRPAFPPPPGRNAPAPAPLVATQHYRDDFAKVVQLGRNDRSTGRSAEEELIGIYWGYDGPPELGTPPRLYMQVVLGVLDDIEARNLAALSVDEELAVVAGAAVAMADAGVHAWYYKYSSAHMLWRPTVGIPMAQAGNGVAEPGWEPLGRPDTNQPGTNPAPVAQPGTGLTPDFPAYPSGHATFGAAAFHVLRLFLVEKTGANFKADGGDSIDFDFVSDEYNGRNIDPRPNAAGGKDPRPHVTRRYPSLWQAIVDNSVSRVYLGVHWEFDGITTRNAADTGDEFGVPANPGKLGHTGGVWLGAQIAKAVAAHMGVSAATITAGKM